MPIAAGIGLWIVAGVVAALLCRFALRSARASNVLTTGWAVLGAVVGGVVGVFPSLPTNGVPWRFGAVTGALAGGLCLGPGYRLVRYRSAKTPRARVRRVAMVVLGITTAALAHVAWFALAVATPRLYRPQVNPNLPSVFTVESLEPEALRLRLTELAEIYLSRQENAGIAIGVTVNGERVVVSGGVASKNAAPAVIDEDSLFEIGSVSKVFTGIALADAIVAGEVARDRRIVEILDDRSSDGLRGLPTELLDLATHASGPPNIQPQCQCGRRSRRTIRTAP